MERLKLDEIHRNSRLMKYIIFFLLIISCSKNGYKSIILREQAQYEVIIGDPQPKPEKAMLFYIDDGGFVRWADGYVQEPNKNVVTYPREKAIYFDINKKPINKKILKYKIL